MKVFISWSGNRSGEIAEILRDCIPSVLQAVEPFFSREDIGKGLDWFGVISKKLEESQFGIICLSKENFKNPWILFEAGAISKNIEKANVCPILFNIDTKEVKGPLAQFQLTVFNKIDFMRILNAINIKLDQPVSQKIFEKAYNQMWPELEEKINKVLSKTYQTNEKSKSDHELLQELLDLTREIASSENKLGINSAVVEDLIDSLNELFSWVNNDKISNKSIIQKIKYSIEYFITQVHDSDNKQNLITKYSELKRNL